MNPDRMKFDRIQSDLNAAFATVQSARARHELGYDAARRMARECVAATVARINQQLEKSPLSESDTRLLQAKMLALGQAAARIPEKAGSAQKPEQAKGPRAGA